MLMTKRKKSTTFTSWDNLDVVLTAKQCADVLQVHLSTIKRLLNAGELPGKKIGRQWRIAKADLKRYMGED